MLEVGFIHHIRGITRCCYYTSAQLEAMLTFKLIFGAFGVFLVSEEVGQLSKLVRGLDGLGTQFQKCREWCI